MLQGPQFRRLFPNAYVVAGTILTLQIWLQAALLVIAKDAAASHTTALRLYGFVCGPQMPLHFSSNRKVATRIHDIEVHRRKGTIHPRVLDGFLVLGPDRTFVDCATQLTLVQLVQAAEHLIHRGFTTLEALWTFAEQSHLDGVRRARRVLHHVCEGVESPMETFVRLMIVFARLPEPVCNQNIFDEFGNHLARGDMVYFAHRVLVEYDGWQHERDGRQRQRDRVRREALEADGWRVIVITSEDLKDARMIPWRVFNALKDHGYDGPAPRMSARWLQRFA